MAVLQALLAFIGRSAGKILHAIFGWAVRALFGVTSGAEQLLLTGLVASAALWPLLVMGVFAPRIAALALAFVPVPERVPTWMVRAVWVVLATALPVVIGLVLAAKAPPGSPREPAVVRIARGYPVTLGLAIAFWLSFITIPVLHLVSIMRGRRDAHIPLVTGTDGYDDAARRIERVLDAHGFALVPREPARWVSAPVQVLQRLGGAAFRHYVPRHLVHLQGPELEVALHPNSVALRGREAKVAYAQGLIVEALTPSGAFQTTAAETQEIERQIRRVWHVFSENPVAHRDSPWLRRRLDEIVSELARVETSYDEWQIVYRQALQLGRALNGEPQLLARTEEGDSAMAYVNEGAGRPRNAAWQQHSTAGLVREVASKATLLIGKEVELARTELKNDIAAELAMAKGLGVAAVAGSATLNMLLVALVFALTPYMAGWAAALAVAGAMLLVTFVAGGIGWHYHVGRPLERTRKTLKEDVQWAKEELA